MQRIFLAVGIVLLVFFLLSCIHSSQQRQVLTELTTIADSIISFRQNSSHSLIIEDKYSGNLPCADFEDITTKIIWNQGNSYLKAETYLVKDGKLFEKKGFYTWNSDVNSLTLYRTNKAPYQIFVGENVHIQLDFKGNRITGNLADTYISKKQEQFTEFIFTHFTRTS